MARVICAVILLAVKVKYGSSTVKNPYAGLCSDISSSSSGVLDTDTRLTNTKVEKLINHCDIPDLQGNIL